MPILLSVEALRSMNPSAFYEIQIISDAILPQVGPEDIRICIDEIFRSRQECEATYPDTRNGAGLVIKHLL